MNREWFTSFNVGQKSHAEVEAQEIGRTSECPLTQLSSLVTIAAEEGSSVTVHQQNLDEATAENETLASKVIHLEQHIAELKLVIKELQTQITNVQRDLKHDTEYWKNPNIIGQVLDQLERAFVQVASDVDPYHAYYSLLDLRVVVLNPRPKHIDEAVYDKLNKLKEEFCRVMEVSDIMQATRTFYNIKEIRLDHAARDFTKEYVLKVLDSTIPNVATREFVKSYILDPTMNKEFYQQLFDNNIVLGFITIWNTYQ